MDPDPGPGMVQRCAALRSYVVTALSISGAPPRCMSSGRHGGGGPVPVRSTGHGPRVGLHGVTPVASTSTRL
jgi:hypothetical protein